MTPFRVMLSILIVGSGLVAAYALFVDQSSAKLPLLVASLSSRLWPRFVISQSLPRHATSTLQHESANHSARECVTSKPVDLRPRVAIRTGLAGAKPLDHLHRLVR